MVVAAGASSLDLRKEEECNEDLDGNVLIGAGMASSLITVGLITSNLPLLYVLYGSVLPLLVNSGASFYILKKGIGHRSSGIPMTACAAFSAIGLAFIAFTLSKADTDKLKIRDEEDYKKGIIFMDIESELNDTAEA